MIEKEANNYLKESIPIYFFFLKNKMSLEKVFSPRRMKMTKPTIIVNFVCAAFVMSAWNECVKFKLACPRFFFLPHLVKKNVFLSACVLSSFDFVRCET
jgi:hypothetical protein